MVTLRALLAALVLAAIAGAWLHGKSYGADVVQARWDRATEKAAKEAREQADRQRAAEDEERKRNAKAVAASNARLADALERLRERPERREMPTAPAPACAGATGADLSRPDAGFLVREAARAERLRAKLSECYAILDAAAGEVPGEVAGH